MLVLPTARTGKKDYFDNCLSAVLAEIIRPAFSTEMCTAPRIDSSKPSMSHEYYSSKGVPVLSSSI